MVHNFRLAMCGTRKLGEGYVVSCLAFVHPPRRRPLQHDLMNGSHILTAPGSIGKGPLGINYVDVRNGE